MSQDNPNWTIGWTENDSDITWRVAGIFPVICDIAEVSISFHCFDRKQAEELCGALHAAEMTFVDIEASGRKDVTPIMRDYDYYRTRASTKVHKLRDAMNDLIDDLEETEGKLHES